VEGLATTKKSDVMKVSGNLGSLLLAFLVAASAQAAGEADNEARQGILPVPDFSGDLWDRNYLTGDWAGTRDEWAAKGIQFDAEYYHYVQDVADGGV
jgi:carbohydrate-selective porin OprB